MPVSPWWPLIAMLRGGEVVRAALSEGVTSRLGRRLGPAPSGDEFGGVAAGQLAISVIQTTASDPNSGMSAAAS